LRQADAEFRMDFPHLRLIAHCHVVIDSAILETIGRQHGVVGAQQLRDHFGWNASKLSRARRQGILLDVTAHVLRLASAPDTFELRCMAPPPDHTRDRSRLSRAASLSGQEWSGDDGAVAGQRGRYCTARPERPRTAAHRLSAASRIGTSSASTSRSATIRWPPLVRSNGSTRRAWPEIRSRSCAQRDDPSEFRPADRWRSGFRRQRCAGRDDGSEFRWWARWREGRDGSDGCRVSR
jgi:hypothetical protein